MSRKLNRRTFVERFTLAAGSLFSLPLLAKTESNISKENTMEEQEHPVKKVRKLGFQWDTLDPFLFCVHHEDHFPKGNDEMGPDASYFQGRHMGDDFIIKDGFRMYHGKTVPGFPGHPHRGFETVTVVRKGLVDHADSLGAAGRYGNGDVQWMTAGKGVQHSEMFPLLDAEKDNPLELFQIWLNLPKRNKMVEPHFKMLWKESIPMIEVSSGKGLSKIELITGKWFKDQAPVPPPNSWAADPTNEVLIANIKMEPNSQLELPLAAKGVNRMVYVYEGNGVQIAQQVIPEYAGVEMRAHVKTIIETGSEEVSILILQGKPIGEQVIQYGPFVMNTKEEIHQAFDDYHKTQFGGWPWPRYDQVHDRSKTRFAKHADGTEEIKEA
ncbi:MAG: pirin family protein [Fluviicola sp.]|jgi:redox-sensitive bicupin YhaK (pirin superfamily)